MQTFEKKRRWQNAKQKNELIAKFHEWNGRPKPNFDLVEIDEVTLPNDDSNNEQVDDYEIDVHPL